ncbi:G/U mismatch-specific DNA glycosylase [Mycolicibacterium aichiense]|uniref:G/U mismatch-specific DNA glycosylase n=1 Tax=Mycolicibacterium aichiense TaxID=1799 RepID=A0AAD1HMC6_9MYCO|nr:G/U mismatch-specific DNA glycosylase [Mycolicibacterium aichiense]MCV7020492.1 G/U mismatch-specific DNA glycosylase [Mycolicibacterium aichiense]BBX08005.1 G/U mismatch-specific DNA glycosylase [Mycolicibacterium aichiense]STZ81814.1 uracil-DNA glycosylase superfamily [Mycolicibacterium aichiense]
MRTYQPDILAQGLDVVFCGINPALTAQADGYNFSSATNRFWAAIHRAGFTDRQLAPSEERSLLDYGCGITAVVTRPTSAAHEVSTREIRQSLTAFETTMRAASPHVLAFLGKPAISVVLGTRAVKWGLQRDPVAGIAAWVLPNPSGRNRRFTLDGLVTAYAELHDYVSMNRSRYPLSRSATSPASSPTSARS